MTNAKPAIAYFEMCDAEIALDDALMRAMGASGEEDTDPETWPCGHMVYDPYDSSFELWSVKVDDWQPTDAQLSAAFALGFAQCWICYDDNTERFYSATGARSPRKPSSTPRRSDAKYRERKLLAEITRLRSGGREHQSADAVAKGPTQL